MDSDGSTASEQDMVAVLIVDDHAVVRQGLRTFLETQPGFVLVAEAESARTAAQRAVDHAPDVALVDLVMPDGDGVEAVRAIKQASPRTQIALLTSYLEDERILPALRAGAISYLLKDIGPIELATAVRRTARGEAVLDPRVAGVVLRELRGQGGNEPLATLSEREREVLRLIANGLNNATIAERLFIGEKTVKSHVSNILSKLHLADRTQAAVYAWRSGVIGRDE